MVRAESQKDGAESEKNNTVEISEGDPLSDDENREEEIEEELGREEERGGGDGEV